MTEAQIKKSGFDALISALGNVDAERFVAMIQRDAFDYTKWQRTLWATATVDELHNAATTHRAETNPLP